MKLTIELIPKTAFYSNVRTNVSKFTWDIIRNKCYKKANYKCEICKGIGDKYPVECHEIWDFNENSKKQTLTGFIALCPNCHKAKHFGLAQINGESNLIINHLMKVNNLKKEIIIQHIVDSFKIWSKRSIINWNLDISYIDKYIDKEDKKN